MVNDGQYSIIMLTLKLKLIKYNMPKYIPIKYEMSFVYLLI